jgi:hypothetical protein
MPPCPALTTSSPPRMEDSPLRLLSFTLALQRTR